MSRGVVLRVNFGAAVDDEDFGVVSLSDDDLLTTAEVASLVGMKATSWRSLVHSGHAPVADDPGVGPVNRRTPRWRRSTIKKYLRERPGRGNRWKR